MKKPQFFIVNIMLVVTSNIWAEDTLPHSSLNPLNEYSPNPVLLEWSVSDQTREATPEIFARLIEGENIYPWQEAELTPALDNSSYFRGMHGVTVQFRSSLPHESFRIADFETNDEMLLLNPALTARGFTINMGVETEIVPGGYGRSFRFAGQYADKATPLPDGAEMGVHFTQRLKELDWSKYRYFEFLYRSNFTESTHLFVKSASNSAEVPILDYSTTGNKPDTWHEIVIDLNDLMSAEERTQMQSVVLTLPMNDKDLDKQYRFYLDGIWLWDDIKTEETTIDSSPPTKPATPYIKLNEKDALISWQPSTDDLSGIAGYSYFFGPGVNEQPDGNINTQKTELKVPFVKPNQFSYYYLKVKAQNHAGMWSETATTRVPVKP